MKQKMTVMLLLIVFLVFSLPKTIPHVEASSLVNIANMNSPQKFTNLSGEDTQYISQSFMTAADGMNLSTIVLPLTKYGTGPYGTVWVEIVLAENSSEPILDFPLCQSSSTGPFVPVSNISTEIYWTVFAVPPTYLMPNTIYCIVGWNENSTMATGFYWWGCMGYNAVVNGTAWRFRSDDPGNYEAIAEVDNLFACGFELLETGSTWVSTPLDANLFMSLFLSLGLGCVGFGMGKGKDSTPAIFLVEFGIVLSYLLGWLPAWILASSFAILGIMLAYKFRSVFNRG